MFSSRFLNSLPLRINCKLLHVSSKLNGALKQDSPLFKLRQKTGLAYNLCREALTKHENNIDEAEAWLKAQSLALGLQKATKVSGRSTREGLIGFSIDKFNQSAFVLELNCETDFVAKNQVFRDLVLDLTYQLSTTKSNLLQSGTLEQNTVKILEPNQELLVEASNRIAPLISRLGENIRIHHATHYQVEDDSTKIFGQIHAQTGQRSIGTVDIESGRFGALVALKDLSQESMDVRYSLLSGAGKALCRHVIGFNPSYIDLPDNIRKHLEDAEKKRESDPIAKSDAIEEDLNPSDHEGSETSNNNRDDWPSLMDQTLIMSGDRPVREFCKENKLSIVYFKRFESGL